MAKCTTNTAEVLQAQNQTFKHKWTLN